MDYLTYAQQLARNEAERLLGKPVDVLPTQHRDLPSTPDHADPEMSTEELCCVVECQLAKMAKALGHTWYPVLGDIRCLIERARALDGEKEQGFF